MKRRVGSGWVGAVATAAIMMLGWLGNAMAGCGGGGGGGGCSVAVKARPGGVILQIVDHRGGLRYVFCKDSAAAKASKDEIGRSYQQALKAWRTEKMEFDKTNKGLLLTSEMPVEPVVKTVAKGLASEAEGKKKEDHARDTAWAVVLIETEAGREYTAVCEEGLAYCIEAARAKYAARYNAWVAAGTDKAPAPIKPKVKLIKGSLAQSTAKDKAEAENGKVAASETKAKEVAGT